MLKKLNLSFLRRSFSRTYLTAPEVSKCSEALRPFKDLCRSEMLSDRVEKVGLKMSTSIQNLSFDAVYNGQDVIIGAETGSGKTYSYLLPLIDRILSQENTTCTIKNKNASIDNVIILAPNNILCEQIQQMIHKIAISFEEIDHNLNIVVDRNVEGMQDWIRNETEVETDSVSSVSSSSNSNSNSKSIHFIICTPKVLSDYIKPFDVINRFEHPLAFVNTIVLDEADMLLDGSYLKSIEFLVTQLKLIRRQFVRENLIKNPDRIVQYILAAATLPSFGTKSIESQAKMLFPRTQLIRSQNMHQHHPNISNIYLKTPAGNNELANVQHTLQTLYEIINKQNDTASNVSNTNSVIQASWIQSLPFSIMIFFNTAKAAQQFGQHLETLNLRDVFVEVHGLIPKNQREDNLQAFLKQQDSKILICTDACARGLDFPFVKYVIQQEFALNVVEHLHRVGRASRGGTFGHAINFYTSAEEDLVRSIRGLDRNTFDETCAASEKDAIVPVKAPTSSIEESFSRRRGFRRKQKKLIAQANEPPQSPGIAVE